MPETITPEQAYSLVVEWLYLNDHSFPNKMDWRKSFLEHLSGVLQKIKVRKE